MGIVIIVVSSNTPAAKRIPDSLIAEPFAFVDMKDGTPVLVRRRLPGINSCGKAPPETCGGLSGYGAGMSHRVPVEALSKGCARLVLRMRNNVAMCCESSTCRELNNAV